MRKTVFIRDYPVEHLPEELREGVSASLVNILVQEEGSDRDKKQDRLSLLELLREPGPFQSEADIQAYFDELRGPAPVDPAPFR